MTEEAGGTSGLEQLATKLQDPLFRKAFAADPARALEGAEISSESIPDDVLEALVELSAQELSALARVRKALVSANVPPGLIVRFV
jgi:hypothetical protein